MTTFLIVIACTTVLWWCVKPRRGKAPPAPERPKREIRVGYKFLEHPSGSFDISYLKEIVTNEVVNKYENDCVVKVYNTFELGDRKPRYKHMSVQEIREVER